MAQLPKRFRRRRDTGAVEIEFWFKGERYRRSFGTDTAEAIRLGRLFRERVLRGELSPVACSSVPSHWDALHEEWLTKRAAARRCNASLTKARQRYGVMEPLMRGVILAEVRSGHVEALLAFLKSRFSEWYCWSCMSDVRAAFHFAVDEGHLKASPFPRGGMPKVTKHVPRRLTDDQLRAIFAAAPDHVVWLLKLMLLTGIRYCDLRALTWDRVILTGRSPALLIESPKTQDVTRVPLTAAAIALLKPHRRDLGPVSPFRSPHGNVLKGRRPSLGFTWSPGRLRHTLATKLREEGADLEVVQMVMRHKDIRTTREHYAVLGPSVIERAFLDIAGEILPREVPTEEKEA